MTKRNYGGTVKAARKVAILVIAVCAGSVSVPALASATTAWVNKNAPVGANTSCANPGFSQIQTAITASAAGTTIKICSGSIYKEQLLIEKQLSLANAGGPVTIALPASPAPLGDKCEETKPLEQDLIMICGPGTEMAVTITGLTIDGRWVEESCTGDDKNAIFVAGHANLQLKNSQVTHAGPEPLNGCQVGIGVQVGRNSMGQVGLATLIGGEVKGYDKNGVTVDGPGSKAKISNMTITGAGPNGFPPPETKTLVAQNGIQISRGAEGKISNVTITGNECEAASCGPNSTGFSPWQEEEDATGVLFYKEGKGSSVTGTQVAPTTISKNDIGVYHLADIEPTTPMVTVRGDKIEKNRYWGVALDQGYAVVSKNTIKGEPGLAGIQAVQYGTEHQFTGNPSGQQFGVRGTGAEDEISGEACAVEGFSDNLVSDQPGSVKLTASLAKIAGKNTKTVCNNNTTGLLTIDVK